jgi:hypothetical protein
MEHQLAAPCLQLLHQPVVEGRCALWDRSADAPVVTGIRSDIREVLITDVMDAEPVTVAEYPEPSIWPFLCAVVTSGSSSGRSLRRGQSLCSSRRFRSR